MLKLVAVLILLSTTYLLFWPVDIDPDAWTPEAPPMNDPRYAANERLSAIERIAENIGKGPEAVNVDAQGRIVTGFIDGRVMRFNAQGEQAELLADTGGRPLGLDFAANGDLIVADAVLGLVRVFLQQGQPTGKWRVLADTADGVTIRFADDVDVSQDDVAYYSDASVKYGIHEVMHDMFEHRPHGRLLATDLKTGDTRVLIPQLHFANGVALGPDENYVLINETAEYRVLRYWLRGERAGQTDVFIDNLPGFPDNITFNGSDTFWLAIYATRVESLDGLLPMPFVRKMVWRLPKSLQPGPTMHGYALGLSLDGEVRHNLQDASEGAFAPITSVRQANGYLYFGSLSAPSLGRMPWPSSN